jgi:ABC-type lipoprotein release transport system permease subunit
MQEGSYNNMIDNVAGFYTGYAQIQDTSYWEKKSLEQTFVYTDSVKQKLVQNDLPNLEHFVPRLEAFALASSGNLTKGSMILGIDPEKEKALIDPKKNSLKGNIYRPVKTTSY